MRAVINRSKPAISNLHLSHTCNSDCLGELHGRSLPLGLLLLPPTVLVHGFRVPLSCGPAGTAHHGRRGRKGTARGNTEKGGGSLFVCVPWLGRSISPVYVLSLSVCCLPSTLIHASTLNSSSISKLRPSLFLTFLTHIASLSSPEKPGKKNILLFLDHKFTRGQSPLPRRLPETNHG